MRKSDFFKSRYIKAEDVEEQPVTLVIESVRREAFKHNGREEHKPVVFFAKAGKGLILNLTNWDAVAELCGEDDPEKWAGTPVELFASTVEVGGAIKPCVRVRRPSGELALKPPKVPAALDDGLDEPIPF